MIQEKNYTYMGTNGTITTPIHLEDIPCIVRYKLSAEDGYILTNGIDKVKSVSVSKANITDWVEIPEN